MLAKVCSVAIVWALKKAVAGTYNYFYDMYH